MNHKDMKIIKIKLFVNNVAQFTAYLANDFITLFVNNIEYFTAYLANSFICIISYVLNIAKKIYIATYTVVLLVIY